jgi:hypothetical protein
MWLSLRRDRCFVFPSATSSTVQFSSTLPSMVSSCIRVLRVVGLLVGHVIAARTGFKARSGLGL